MAKLTSKERKGLSTSSFAIPEKRAYPIENISHARNALARVSQFGTPEEKARVRAAVHRKYPEIGKQETAKRIAKHPSNYETDYAEMRSGKKTRMG